MRKLIQIAIRIATDERRSHLRISQLTDEYMMTDEMQEMASSAGFKLKYAGDCWTLSKI